MARLSKTGSKTGRVKARKAIQIKGRKNAKTKNGTAPAAKVSARLSVSELEAQLERRTIELSETLAQQAAATEVLQAINGSGGDLKPVLDAMVTKAAELCDATGGGLYFVDGDKILNIFGSTSGTSAVPSELMGVPLAGILGPNPLARPFVHVVDLKATKGYRNGVPFIVASVGSGIRSWLGVPIISDSVIVAVFALFRSEVRPFSENQIRLLQSFAVQASIATKNARLFNETKQALEWQIATSEILRVISQSPTEVQPVFDAIVQTAVRLIRCDIAFVLRCEGATFSPAAGAGPDGPLPDLGPTHLPIDPDANFPSRAIVGKKNVHLPNWSSIDLPEHERQMQALIGVNSALFLPLLREAECIGVLALAGKRANIFGENEIALAESFRDQALIAIENVRLFDEVQAKTRDLEESLQQQTATADVLKVISRSAFDLQTVFNTLIDSAVALSGALSGTICLRDGDGYRYVATSSDMQSDFAKWLFEHPPTFNRASAAGRVLLSGKVEEVPDILEDPDYTLPVVSLNRTRSVIGVPLLGKDRLEGALALTRTKPGHFSQRQIELVQTFADQAVIAIENVRLFDEVQARTKELAASLDELRTAQDRLVQTEKLASLGQLTAGIAHEIKNPLNFVNNFSALSAELIDELDETLAPAALDQKMRADVSELTQMLKSNLEKVVQHGKRADSIVKNMLLHSREGSGEQRPAEINALLDESLNLAYHGARAEKPEFNITLRRDMDPDAGAIDVFPQEITRAFINLISNGFYAASKRKAENGDPDFEPVLSAATKNLGKQVEIRIRDNGIGIPPEVREKIFNPFFTTKPAGEGTGLGLSMSHDIIVKQHGGRIEVDTQPGQFTEFTIVLPRTTSPANNRKS